MLQNKMKLFTNNDIQTVQPIPSSRVGVPYNKLNVGNYQENLVNSPLWWHKRGLSQTASGYGMKLTTKWKINVDGKLYRVYCACYSNNGTAYFYKGKERIIIN